MPQRFLSYNGFALVTDVALGITVIIAFSNFSDCQLHFITVWPLWPVLTP